MQTPEGTPTPNAEGAPSKPLALAPSLALLAAMGLLLALFVATVPTVGALARRVAWPLALSSLQCLAALGAAASLRGLVHRYATRTNPTPPTADSLCASVAFDLVAGYPLFGAAVFVVALATVHKLVMLALMVVFAAAGVARLRRSVRVTSSATALDGPAIASVFALVAGLWGAVMQAQLPAFTLDEVVYHLTIPKAWILEGRPFDTPLLSQSYFPLGIETADLPPLALLGDRGALSSHFTHVAVAVASCALLFAWLRRRVSAQVAVVLTAAVATTPALLVTTGWSWNEWPLLGLCVGLLAALDELTGENASADPMATGVALSVAGGLLCKYTFIAYAAPLFVAAWSVLRTDTEKTRTLGRAALVGGVFGGVFFLRNLALTGNPIAPFLDPLSPHVTRFREGATAAATLVAYIYDEGTSDEALGVTLLAGVLSLALCWRGLREERWLTRAAAGLAAVLAVLSFARPSARLLTPFLAGVGVVGLVALARALDGRAARAALWALAVASVAQTVSVVTFFDYLRPLATLMPGATERGFLEASRTGYEPIAWLNQQTPASSRTLVIGLNQLFWMSHPFGGGGNFDGPRMAHYLEAESPIALHIKLRRDGYTHIALYRPRVLAGSGPVDGRRAEAATVLTPRAIAALNGVLTIGSIPRGAHNRLELFELR